MLLISYNLQGTVGFTWLLSSGNTGGDVISATHIYTTYDISR